MAVSAFLREQPGVTRRALAGLRGHGLLPPSRARSRSSPHTKLFALAESLGGVESLVEVPQAMTHQSVEGSAAAVPAGPRAAELRDRGGGGPRRGPAPGDRGRRAGQAGARAQADPAPRRSDAECAACPRGRAPRRRRRPAAGAGALAASARRRDAARAGPAAARRPTRRPRPSCRRCRKEHEAKVVEPVAGARRPRPRRARRHEPAPPTSAPKPRGGRAPRATSSSPGPPPPATASTRPPRCRTGSRCRRSRRPRPCAR